MEKVDIFEPFFEEMASDDINPSNNEIKTESPKNTQNTEQDIQPEIEIEAPKRSRRSRKEVKNTTTVEG